MSKLSKSGIEDALGIPSIEELASAMDKLNTGTYLVQDEDLLEPTEIAIPPTKEDLQDAYTAVRSMKKEMNVVPDINNNIDKLERITDMCTKYFEDIMDKAFNSEDRFSSNFMEAANSLLSTAVDSHNAIALAKIKFTELELKRRKLESDINGSDARVINAENGVVADRNSMLKKKQPK